MTLQRLRHETAHLHERIERTLDLPVRLASLPAYTALLTRFHGFYAPLEDRVAGSEFGTAPTAYTDARPEA